MFFLKDEYIWNQCCLLTQPAMSRPLCALNSRWQLLIAAALLLHRDTRTYWSSQPHKEPGDKIFFFLHPPPPSLSACPTWSPQKGKVRTVSEREEKADLTATRTICQTVWLLSTPDRGGRTAPQNAQGREGPKNQPLVFIFAISSMSGLAGPQFLKQGPSGAPKSSLCTFLYMKKGRPKPLCLGRTEYHPKPR